jgi:hypothetical protein
MGMISFVTTARTYQIHTHAGESVLEAFRRSNIPVQGTLLLDSERQFLSLTTVLDDGGVAWAYAMRNADFSCVIPEYTLVRSDNPAAEIVRPLNNPKNLGIIQYSREGAMEYIYRSVAEVLLGYLETQSDSPSPTLQFALSPGGDGRVLAECLHRFNDENPQVGFHALIVAVGFEDERQHVDNAVSIADRYSLPYTVLGVDEAAASLGYSSDLNVLAMQFRSRFPTDEPEVMLTYWVQQLNFSAARTAGRRAILFGYNQEDVVADRIYQALTGKLLPPFPIRRLGEFDIVAPLCQIPKKMLDAMDTDNSLRNYTIRSPSVSYLRSSLYLLSYILVEQFPAIADILAGHPLEADDPDLIFRWLGDQAIEPNNARSGSKTLSLE